jgi:hypothetical protein
MNISDLKNEIGQKTVNMISLVIASFGVYAIVWIVERYKVFNRLAGKEVVSNKLIIWTTIVFGLNAAMSRLGPKFILIMFIAQIALFVFYVIIAFKFAKVMDEFYAKEFKLDLKFNKFYLIIFNLYYINYSINELEEIEQKMKLLKS